MLDDLNTQTQTEAVNSGAKNEKMIPQSEFDSLIQKRLSRAQESFKKRESEIREEAIRSYLDENGLDETIIDKAKSLESTESEMKKMKRSLEKAESERQKMLLENENFKHKYSSNLIKSSILTAAGSKFRNPSDAVLHLQSRVRLSDDDTPIVVDEKGNITDLSVESLVDGLLKERDYLAAPRQTPLGSGSRPATSTTMTSSELREAQRQMFTNLLK
jgi:hypothetical protein